MTKVGSTLLLLVAMVLLSNTVSAQGTTDVPFTVSGTVASNVDYQSTTFTVPAGVTKLTVQCWGAGATGAYAIGRPHVGAGGGGGAYARGIDVPVTPGEILTVQIGVGGRVPGSKTDNATKRNGGNTIVKRADGTILVKAAGAEATTNNQSSAGKGGQKSNCVYSGAGYTGVAYAGGNGGAGGEWSTVGCSGSGGGAAGTAGAGGNGVDAGVYLYGYNSGGVKGICNWNDVSDAISGAGGISSNITVAGAGDHGRAGSDYGGGGSGNVADYEHFLGDDLRGYYKPGKGGDGYVLITYVNCVPPTAGEIALQPGESCGKVLANVTEGTGTLGAYSWQKSEDGSNNWQTIADATSATYTPSDTAYYRRGYTACGLTEYTSVVYADFSVAAPGNVTNAGGTETTFAICKNNDLNYSLQASNYGFEATTTIYWQYKTTGDWQADGSASASTSHNVNVTGITEPRTYRYYYNPQAGCNIYSDEFTFTVDTGVVNRADLNFDASTVTFVLPYGAAKMAPVIDQPTCTYQDTVTYTYNGLEFLVTDTLLGTVDTGVYAIVWKITDCTGSFKEFTKNYVVEYPACGNVISDIEGNEYQTVRINHNCWLKENLRTRHFNTGDTIENAYPYDNADSNATNFGMLYTWNDAQSICPSGWHLPTIAQMQDLLNSYGEDGLRSDSHWTAPGTDASGFSMLPAGYKNANNNKFEGIYNISYMWTADNSGELTTECVLLDCGCPAMQKVVPMRKSSAMSVRCIHE